MSTIPTRRHPANLPERGAPEFTRDSREIPLLGCKVDIAQSTGKTFPLLLFCSDFTGYRNLKALLSIPALKGGHPVNMDNLKAHSEGLIAVISGKERDLAALLREHP